MTRCRKLSLVGGSPPISRPLSSSCDSRAGSSRPRDALVGVISQPFSTLTLMLPDDPAVSPRLKIDAPISQIASRALGSFMAALHQPTLTHRSLARPGPPLPHCGRGKESRGAV